jgi:hypothetical protein
MGISICANAAAASTIQAARIIPMFFIVRLVCLLLIVDF